MGAAVKVELDDRDLRGGEKAWSWIKGMPIRVEVGPRDVENNAVFVGRRDHALNQNDLSNGRLRGAGACFAGRNSTNALRPRQTISSATCQTLASEAEFVDYFTGQQAGQAGFASVGFCCDPDLEESIAKQYKLSVRCIPQQTAECTALSLPVSQASESFCSSLLSVECSLRLRCHRLKVAVC